MDSEEMLHGFLAHLQHTIYVGAAGTLLARESVRHNLAHGLIDLSDILHAAHEKHARRWPNHQL